MAKPILCNGPDGGPAVVMVSLLGDGETLGLCGECLTDWCEATLKAVAPERLAPPPAKTKTVTRTRRPRATPVTAVLGADGRDSGDTLIGDKLVQGNDATA